MPAARKKTTFATQFLPREGGIIHFVNADLIATGLAPLQPSLATLNAGRVSFTRSTGWPQPRRTSHSRARLAG